MQSKRAHSQSCAVSLRPDMQVVSAEGILSSAVLTTVVMLLVAIGQTQATTVRPPALVVPRCVTLWDCTHANTSCINGVCVNTSVVANCSDFKAAHPAAADGTCWVGGALEFCDMQLGVSLCSETVTNRTGRARDGSNLTLSFTSVMNVSAGVCRVWALRSGIHPMYETRNDTCRAFGFVSGTMRANNVTFGLDASGPNNQSPYACGFPGFSSSNTSQWMVYAVVCSKCAIKNGSFDWWTQLGPARTMRILTTFDGSVSLECRTQPLCDSASYCSQRGAARNLTTQRRSTTYVWQPYCICSCNPGFTEVSFCATTASATMSGTYHQSATSSQTLSSSSGGWGSRSASTSMGSIPATASPSRVRSKSCTLTVEATHSSKSKPSSSSPQTQSASRRGMTGASLSHSFSGASATCRSSTQAVLSSSSTVESKDAPPAGHGTAILDAAMVLTATVSFLFASSDGAASTLMMSQIALGASQCGGNYGAADGADPASVAPRGVAWYVVSPFWGVSSVAVAIGTPSLFIIAVGLQWLCVQGVAYKRGLSLEAARCVCRYPSWSLVFGRCLVQGTLLGAVLSCSLAAATNAAHSPAVWVVAGCCGLLCGSVLGLSTVVVRWWSPATLDVLRVEPLCDGAPERHLACTFLLPTVLWTPADTALSWGAVCSAVRGPEWVWWLGVSHYVGPLSVALVSGLRAPYASRGVACDAVTWAAVFVAALSAVACAALRPLRLPLQNPISSCGCLVLAVSLLLRTTTLAELLLPTARADMQKYLDAAQMALCLLSAAYSVLVALLMQQSAEAPHSSSSTADGTNHSMPLRDDVLLTEMFCCDSETAHLNIEPSTESYQDIRWASVEQNAYAKPKGGVDDLVLPSMGVDEDASSDQDLLQPTILSNDSILHRFGCSSVHSDNILIADSIAAEH